MKRKTFLLTGVALLLALLLAGCGGTRREKEAKALAQDYLDRLKVSVSDDTLRFANAEPQHFGELIAFSVESDRYTGTFRINVNADNSVTDSYFSISLQADARSEFAALLKASIPENTPEFSLYLRGDTVSSALSGKPFSSIYEAQEAVGDAFGLSLVYLLSEISEDDLAALLSAMQDAGFYGDLFAAAGDVRTFHISEDEINFTRSDDPPGDVRVYDYVPGSES